MTALARLRTATTSRSRRAASSTCPRAGARCSSATTRAASRSTARWSSRRACSRWSRRGSRRAWPRSSSSRMPFVSEWTSRTGQLTGLPENAERLLEDERLLVVFPEGARGTAKLYRERYSLVDFGSGFVRLALKTRDADRPVRRLRRRRSLPHRGQRVPARRARSASRTCPSSPYGLPVPLPAKIEIEYAPPLHFSGTGQRGRRRRLRVRRPGEGGHRRDARRGCRERRGGGRRLPQAGQDEARATRVRRRAVRVLLPGISGVLGRKVADAPGGRGARGRRASIARPWRERARSSSTRSTSASAPPRTSSARRGPRSSSTWRRSRSLAVSGEERYRINLGGTRAVFEHSRAYGVEHCIFVGRHTFYGAGDDSPLFHTEDEPPLALEPLPGAGRSGRRGPLRRHGALALPRADHVGAARLLHARPERARHARELPSRQARADGPRLRPALPVHARGRRGHARSCSRSRSGRAASSTSPARSRCRCRASSSRDRAHASPSARSSSVKALLGRFGLPKLPPGALGHVKYPVVVDARAFREQTGFSHALDEVQTLDAYRRAFPPPG